MSKGLYEAHDAEIEEAKAALPNLPPVKGMCERCFHEVAYTIVEGQKLCRGCYYAAQQFNLKEV